MRVAAICDIHGNLPALEAVVKDVERAGVDEVVMAGDVVPGPMPRECIDLLLTLPVPVRFLYGNCEVGVLDAAAGKELAGLPEQAKEPLRWTAGELRETDKKLFAGWPKTQQLSIDGIGGNNFEALFCHATPQDENPIFTRLTPEADLLPMFSGVGADVVVCGHTHMQFDRQIGATRVVNAGSVGMPFGEPGAYWLLLGPGIELRRTQYDLKTAAERIRATRYPQAAHFAENHVLKPPSEQAMLELFTKAAKPKA